MKTFKSFIQLDEVERAKLKGADKLAPDNKVAEVKPLPADLAKLGSVDKTKDGQGKRKADRLDNKQPFGEAESHQSKTTMKHISNPNAAEKKAAKLIKPGIKGVRDRLDMLKAAKDRGALKENDITLLSNLYDNLDKSNQEIFLDQLEENAEALLAFAKTIAEE